MCRSIRTPHSLTSILTIVALILLPGCMTVEMTAGPASSVGVARVRMVGAVDVAATTSSRMMGGALSASGRAIGDARGRSADFAVDVMDSGPAPHAGFLAQPERMSQLSRDRHPFHRVWVSPDLQRKRYAKIAVAPVVVDHLLENSWWDNMSTATLFGLDDDAERLSLRLQDSVEQAFRSDPSRRFLVTDQVDDETLILELALVELVPNKSVVALGALAALAAPPAISTPLGFFASQAEHGFVAIEGRVRDGGTGEVMVMFADRETSKTRVLDLQSLLWYGHAHEIIDEWAEQLVAVANRPQNPGVPDPSPFTLVPW